MSIAAQSVSPMPLPTAAEKADSKELTVAEKFKHCADQKNAKVTSLISPWNTIIHQQASINRLMSYSLTIFT